MRHIVLPRFKNMRDSGKSFKQKLIMVINQIIILHLVLTLANGVLGFSQYAFFIPKAPFTKPPLFTDWYIT